MSLTEPRLGTHFASRRERGIEGLPTLSVTIDRGLVLRETLERRTETNLSAAEHLRVRPGDIVYNMMRMWQGASGLAEVDALVSPAYVVLAPKKTIDPRFASYLFKLPETIHRFWAYSYGLTDDRLRLYFNDFKRIPWDIPPLAEQKKIAEILITWDKAIETTEKLLANAEAQKRSLMQQLLTGKRRLKGFAGGWQEAPLGDLGSWSGGGTPSKSNAAFWGGGDIPWVSPKDMKAKRIFDTEDHITESAVCQSAVRIYPPGSILIVTRSGILRREVPVAIAMRKMAVNQDIKVLSPSPNISMEYVANVLWANNHRLLVECVKEGTTVESIDTPALMRFKVPIPPLEEQMEIAAMMSLLDKAICAHEARVAGLHTEKRALMQQLFTGKRRVTI
ncbi:restriction endonuclease subunit S [Rhizobium leguminosarum]